MNENEIKAPTCPYCGAKAGLKNSRAIYGRDKDYGFIWLCSNWPRCDAYVGVHQKTLEPLGTLADAKLREWRWLAHNAFDPIWKTKLLKRPEAYELLGKILHLPEEKAHIAMLSIYQCRKVIEYVRAQPEFKEVSCSGMP